MFVRSYGDTLRVRLTEPRRFIQVIAGPRQVGKTTLARQVAAGFERRVHFASADEPLLKDRQWLGEQWKAGRDAAQHAGAKGAILVLDEIQKISAWSEAVKRFWDEDTHAALRAQSSKPSTPPW